MRQNLSVPVRELGRLLRKLPLDYLRERFGQQSPENVPEHLEDIPDTSGVRTNHRLQVLDLARHRRQSQFDESNERYACRQFDSGAA